MALKDLTSETAGELIDRINAIKDVSQRKWGTMTPAQMFRHMTLSLKGGLGEVEVQDRSNFVFRTMRPILFSGLIPMPKGADTAPEYVVEDDVETESERAELLETIQRFLDFCEIDPHARTQHPLFGMMTVAQWQRGHGLHFEHHLRQFGV